ncbi:hypothetical protein GALMADRAFT_258296 [Galerina marginata CBS 339.88]|uniref:F-box domain-containing protein n=1 Tax=Galerina marginata (strain CBS 339.88) TaxID=685588 RepID=A0A067S918_GALM3|nr:hypothetical protein GALMADRAFT_258296 [Galerina marginata CBS 339.88]
MANSPPIHRLHSDILWRFFSLNADMELDFEDYFPAMDTLRTISQVCPLWRGIAMNSPSLWGRVVNIDAVFKRRAGSMTKWGNEVLRRSGDSSLHIKARLDTKVKEDVVESLVRQNWHRIQSLDLEFQKGTPISGEKWQEIFRVPAGALEGFRIRCNGYQEESKFVLFQNNAPSLRRISITNFVVDMKEVSWASNLRYIEMCSSIFAFELLGTLFVVQFPFLECIVCFDYGAGLKDVDKEALPVLRPISLPCLRRIQLNVGKEVNTILTMLMHITPNEQCALDLAVDKYFVNNYTLDLLREVLPKFLRYAARMSPATDLRLVLKRDWFIFLQSSERSFSFHVQLPVGLHERAISVFPFCFAHTTFRLDSIEKLVFRVVEDEDMDLLLANESMEKLVLRFLSVKSLETDSETLVYLSRFQTKTRTVPFPSLKTVKSTLKDDDEIIKHFLDSRAAAGVIGTISFIGW